MYKFRDWLDQSKIDWRKISLQTSDAAIQILEQNPDKIVWEELSANPAATHILMQNRDLANWYFLSHNQHAFPLFRQIYEEEINVPPTQEELDEEKEDFHREIIEDIMRRLINDIIAETDETDPEAIYGNESPTPEEMRDVYANLADEHDIFWNTFCKNAVYPEAIELLEQNPDKINWRYLSANTATRAIELLEQNLDKINWEKLSANPATRAIQLLEQNPDKINWVELSKNTAPGAIRLLEQNPDKIVWYNFSQNRAAPKYAIHLFEENVEKIHWNGDISYFQSDEAIRFIEKHLDKVNWKSLTTNPRAIHILEQNPDKIFWPNLSLNTAPGAIRLLEQSPERIPWWFLMPNPAAIELIERNIDKINWNTIWSNPAIFVYDYARMRSHGMRAALHEELIARVFRPERILAHLESGGDLDDL